jgi:hypothetical protein
MTLNGVRGKPGAKECEWFLALGKNKEIDFSIALLRKQYSPANTLIVPS